MTVIEVLKSGLSSTRDLLNGYIGDLSDADLTVRVVPAANNIGWQLGHLITSEVFLLSVLPGATYPELSSALKAHSMESAKSDPKEGYLTRAQYAEWFNKVRDASIANVGRLTDADLDKPAKGPLEKHAPTIGTLILVICNHTLMHGGQFTVVRRSLGKPVLF